MNQQFSQQRNAKNKGDLKAKDGAVATVSWTLDIHLLSGV